MRVRILCEDRRTERFLRRLCEHRGLRVVDVDVAPVGRGDASVYVRRRYAEHVRKRRYLNYQQNLGGIVAIDGDDVGVRARKSQLEQGLVDAGLDARGAEEPLAVFVPAWSIETWLVVLRSHLRAFTSTELEPLEDAPSVRAQWGAADLAASTSARSCASC